MGLRPDRTAFRSALLAACIYALFGFLWIRFSDLAVTWWTQDIAEVEMLQTYKGWIYVTLSALIGFVLVYISEKRLRQRAEVLEQEIQHRMQLEARQRLMMNELDHRVKNNLASILSLSKLSQAHARDFADYHQKLQGRIRTMARTHEQLARHNWLVVDLETLIRAIVTTVPEDEPAIRGPSVKLASRHAATLAMIIHEIHANLLNPAVVPPRPGIHMQWKTQGDRLTLTCVQTLVTNQESVAVMEQTVKLISELTDYELNGITSVEARADHVITQLTLPDSAYTLDPQPAKPTPTKAKPQLTTVI